MTVPAMARIASALAVSCSTSVMTASSVIPSGVVAFAARRRTASGFRLFNLLSRSAKTSLRAASEPAPAAASRSSGARMNCFVCLVKAFSKAAYDSLVSEDSSSSRTRATSCPAILVNEIATIASATGKQL